MKTVDELKKQPPVFLNNWNDTIDVIGDFEEIFITSSEFKSETCPYSNAEYWKERKEKMKSVLEDYKYRNINILFASYGNDNYSGDAFVLFERDGQLYEVNGAHCSCYGLEGQWSEEETTIASLARRLTDGFFGKDEWSGNIFNKQLKEFLGIE